MTEEREMLRRTVAALVDRHAPPDAVRRAMSSDRGYDESLWALLCEQVGATALVVPEEFGGAGGEQPDAAVVFEELGRALVPTPLLGTTLAEMALLAADAPDATALERLAGGRVVGALVFDPDHVVHGDVADIVVAVRQGRIERWTQVVAEPLTPLDPTRRLARLRPGRTEVIGSDPGLAATAAMLMATEQVGAAARCLQLTVDYTKQRVLSAGPPAASRPSSTGWPIFMSAFSPPGRCWPGRSPILARPPPALARLAAAEAFCVVAGEAIRYTAGSPSPGSTTSSCTSSGPIPAPNCWTRLLRCCADWKIRVL